MESTLVDGGLLVGLLAVDIVDNLGGNGGRVQVNSVKGSRGALLAGGTLLGDLEVVHGRGAGRPDGAKDLVGLAVQVSEVRRGRVGGEQKDGFLEVGDVIRFGTWEDASLGYQLTLKAFSARSQRPKQVLLPPVVKISQSSSLGPGVRMDCQLLRVTGVTRFSVTFSASFSTGATGAAVGT